MTRVPTFVCGVPSSWKAPRRLSEQGLEIVKARLDKVEIVWKLKYYHFHSGFPSFYQHPAAQPFGAPYVRSRVA